MKMSKLRYVFAFLLVAVVALATVNVSAATRRYPVSKLSVSKIASTYALSPFDRWVESFNTNVYLPVNGEEKNVGLYTYHDSIRGIIRKAYAYDTGKLATGAETEVTDLTVGYSDADTKIGLALTYGMGVLDADTLLDQSGLSEDQLNLSMATQAYIWAVSGKVDSAAIRAGLNEYAQDYYDALVDNVNRALTRPSFAYATADEAKANPIQMMWNPETSRYEARVEDSPENYTYADNIIPKEGGAIHYYKDGVSSIVYYTTEQVGSAADPVVLEVNKSISLANYPGYVTVLDPNAEEGQFVTKSGVAIAPSTSYVSFYTNALRIEVTKDLGTANGNGNTKTGDATAAGAVYGIYSDEACNTLVERVVTNKDGVALSNPLELKDYWVKEIINPDGTIIDGEKYPAAVGSATVESNGQRMIRVKSTNQVIYGGVTLNLSVSDLSGETTKEEAVGSEIVLTLDSDPTQQYTGYIDDHGDVEFKNIPYGRYTCKEMKKNTPEVNFMDPIHVFINENGKVIHLGPANDEVAQRDVRLVKVDADSGLPITKDSAIFEVRDEEDNIVSTTSQNPIPGEVLSSYTTNNGFVVLPEKIPYGTYKVYELDAPDGYYNEGAALNKEVATFKVETNTSEDPYNRNDEVVVEIKNKPQKVMLKITTKGSVPTLNDVPVNVEGRNVYRPSYMEATIPGVEYRLTALEDVVTGDGVVHMAAGTSKILNSDEEQELYIGRYQIEQVKVPEGYMLNTEVKVLDLTTKVSNQKDPGWEENITYNIQRQTYNLDVEKKFEDLKFYKKNAEGKVESVADYSSVVIGIYAAEDIKNVLGETVITADTLVDITRLDSAGRAVFGSMLPKGKFYALELESNTNYKVNDTHYYIDAAPIPESYDTLTFQLEKVTIVNEPKNETTFKLVKVEKVDLAAQTTSANQIEMMITGATEGAGSNELDRTVETTTLEGAKFGIFYTEGGEELPLLELVNGEYVDVVRTTDENGEIVIEGLPFGEYVVKELEAPKYYELNDKEFSVNLTPENPKPEELVVQDERTMVNYKVTVTDEDEEVVEGAVVELVDPETNKVVYTLETNEDGVADFGSVRAGRYVRKITPPECYVAPEDTEVYIEDKVKGVEQKVTVKYVTGNILIYKTDAETSEPLPGCTFQVLDYETGDLIVEVESGDDGYVEVRGLRYGKYIVVETAAPENYEISEDQYEVNIVKDGETVTVEFANIPTGDIAVAAYVLVAMISLFAIVKTSKKLRKN